MVTDSEDDNGTSPLSTRSLPLRNVDPKPDDSTQSEHDSEEDNDGGSEKERNDEDNEEADNEDDDEEDEEPILKTHALTVSLPSLYRGGDATSSFLVSGDKMIVGTHNGTINVFSVPSMQPLSSYNAHKATVSSVSVSPYPIPQAAQLPELLRLQSELRSPSSSPATASSASNSPQVPQKPKPALPATPSNSIYIASSSIEGRVCIASLLNPGKDFRVRNFQRPIHAVALSPNFKHDQSYLSGGKDGSLVLTIGGKIGQEEKANISSLAAATNWLTHLNLGSNSGKDVTLHTGEGTISMIKWSTSGKFVVWANELGFKIMRSNIQLDSVDADHAWTRIAHVDRPNRPEWDAMSAVWKARAEWQSYSDDERDEQIHSNEQKQQPPASKQKLEKLVVGWGDCVWILHVQPEYRYSTPKKGLKVANSTADIVQHLHFDDCIISGVSFFNSALLAVLAYLNKDENEEATPTSPVLTPRRGAHQRQIHSLPPELRLININTKEEVSCENLSISRFDGLSAQDYHLGSISVPAPQAVSLASRSTLEALGGMWDASVAGINLVTTAPIISSAASIKNTVGGLGFDFRSPTPRPSNPASSANLTTALPRRRALSAFSSPDIVPAAKSPGLKLVIHSPYDCIIALKRDATDHLSWLLERKRYKEAFDLVVDHPEIISTGNVESSSDDAPSTPTRNGRSSLRDFFSSDRVSQVSAQVIKKPNTMIECEQRRIGELWLQQLVDQGDWLAAAQATPRVLGDSTRWEPWITTFAKAGRFDEITPFVPSKPVSPALSYDAYKIILVHYIESNFERVRELIDSWDGDVYDVDVLIHEIQDKMTRDEVSQHNSEKEWAEFSQVLAKLYLDVAIPRPREALKLYIQLQDFDAAMNIIREYNLVEAVSDDIPAFLSLRVPKVLLSSASLADLEEASNEAVSLLVKATLAGSLKPGSVKSQLEVKGKSYRPFLFFYLRALWNSPPGKIKSGRFQKHEAEGRSFFVEFGDLAANLFAEYDRPLFLEYLEGSTAYSYDEVNTICNAKHYYPELVYIYSQTGQTKQALDLIINTLGDVDKAINFAKDQNDKDLWNDLIDYSMDKPPFIIGLLETAGTSIDPIKLVKQRIKLVKRIPKGLKIEGLRKALRNLLREHEIQASISDGVAKVLRSEVASSMEILRQGRANGIRFDLPVKQAFKKMATAEPKIDLKLEEVKTNDTEDLIEPLLEPGHCVACKEPFLLNDNETLIGFACGHAYHLSCIISTITDPNLRQAAEDSTAVTSIEDEFYQSVAAKVAHAHIIKSYIGKGCQLSGCSRGG